MDNKLKLFFPELEQELAETKALLREQLLQLKENNHLEIAEMITNLIQSGGKMLRPTLVFLFSKMGPDQAQINANQTRAVAAAMEVLHLATLVHDDVIDDSPVRRFQPTIHTKYGKRNAIYAGDFLFTVFFELLSKNAISRQMIEHTAEKMRWILLGELDQMNAVWNYDWSYDEYLHEVQGKTAMLFALSALNGIAQTSDDQQQQQAAYDFGLNMGIAFQMADDLLDFTSTAKTGKPVFEDLHNGIFSLPVILALQADQDQMLRSALETHQTDQKVTSLIEARGGFTKTREKIDEFIGRARQNLQIFANTRERRTLAKILDELERSY